MTCPIQDPLEITLDNVWYFIVELLKVMGFIIGIGGIIISSKLSISYKHSTSKFVASIIATFICIIITATMLYIIKSNVFKILSLVSFIIISFIVIYQIIKEKIPNINIDLKHNIDKLTSKMSGQKQVSIPKPVISSRKGANMFDSIGNLYSHKSS